MKKQGKKDLTPNGMARPIRRMLASGGNLSLEQRDAVVKIRDKPLTSRPGTGSGD